MAMQLLCTQMNAMSIPKASPLRGSPPQGCLLQTCSAVTPLCITLPMDSWYLLRLFSYDIPALFLGWQIGMSSFQIRLERSCAQTCYNKACGFWELPWVVIFSLCFRVFRVSQEQKTVQTNMTPIAGAFLDEGGPARETTSLVNLFAALATRGQGSPLDFDFFTFNAARVPIRTDPPGPTPAGSLTFNGFASGLTSNQVNWWDLPAEHMMCLRKRCTKSDGASIFAGAPA